MGTRIRRHILHNQRAEYGEQILSALSSKLGWTHFRQIVYLDDPLQRDLYAEMGPW